MVRLWGSRQRQAWENRVWWLRSFAWQEGAMCWVMGVSANPMGRAPVIWSGKTSGRVSSIWTLSARWRNKSNRWSSSYLRSIPLSSRACPCLGRFSTFRSPIMSWPAPSMPSCARSHWSHCSSTVCVNGLVQCRFCWCWRTVTGSIPSPMIYWKWSAGQLSISQSWSRLPTGPLNSIDYWPRASASFSISRRSHWLICRQRRSNSWFRSSLGRFMGSSPNSRRPSSKRSAAGQKVIHSISRSCLTIFTIGTSTRDNLKRWSRSTCQTVFTAWSSAVLTSLPRTRKLYWK